MGRLSTLNVILVFALALSAPVVAPRFAWAAEDSAHLPELREPSDPCGFYRGQAYGRGLDHFLTEMLWACEAIAVRRRAEMPLSDRLAAAEQALERYREALIAAGAAVFVHGRSSAASGLQPAANDAVKASLADSTGTLTALEAIRSGY